MDKTTYKLKCTIDFIGQITNSPGILQVLLPVCSSAGRAQKMKDSGGSECAARSSRAAREHSSRHDDSSKVASAAGGGPGFLSPPGSRSLRPSEIDAELSHCKVK